MKWSTIAIPAVIAGGALAAYTLLKRPAATARVGIRPLTDVRDQYMLFTVKLPLVGNIVGQITSVIVTDHATGKTYNIYPAGAQAYCTPGASNLKVSLTFRNAGTLTGDFRARLLEPFGAWIVIKQVDFSGVASGELRTLEADLINMPSSDYNLQVDIWHTE